MIDNLIPTWTRVLLRMKPAEEKIGSIIMPEVAKDNQKYLCDEAYVESLGQLAFKDVLKPEKGQKVLVMRNAGTLKQVDGVDYRIVNETDIIAIVNEESL